MKINNSLDTLVKNRQEKCPHNIQDRIKCDTKTFCGKCGVEK